MRPLSAFVSIAVAISLVAASCGGSEIQPLVGDQSTATRATESKATVANTTVATLAAQSQQQAAATTAPTSAPQSVATAAPPPTNTAAPAPTATPVPATATKPPPTAVPPTAVPPTATKAANCSPAYPTVCIPPAPPDLDCKDILFRRFTVLPPDPHGFDGNDNDGLGCES